MSVGTSSMCLHTIGLILPGWTGGTHPFQGTMLAFPAVLFVVRLPIDLGEN